MRRNAMLTGILVFLCLSVAAAQDHEPSLPPNLKIVPPGAGVPPAVAQLSGIWEGAWDYTAPPGGGSRKVFAMDITGRGVKIAIVEITPPKVEALYVTSGSPGNPGKSFRVRDASVSGDAIILKWGQPGSAKTVTLRSSGSPGTVQATMQTEGTNKVHKATLRKK